MIPEPSSLLDVGAVRTLASPTLGAPRRPGAVVVLGSTQPVEVLDDRAIERDGVAVLRRNGGGGAVLLRSEDCWVELWLPAEVAGDDVRATAALVGGWWAAALGELGVVTTRHRGGMVDAAQGAVACFAGIGPGELLVEGHKLLGLSQWRAREGALVSSVLAASPPSDLAAYLSPRSDAVPSLASATCLNEALSGVGADALAAAFEREVAGDLPGLVRADAPFR